MNFSKNLKLKVTAIVEAALEGLASLTQQDFAAVLFLITKTKIITKIEIIIPKMIIKIMITIR